MAQKIARPLTQAAGRTAAIHRTPVDLMATSFEVEGHLAGDPVPAVDAMRVGHIRRIVAARLRYLGLSAFCDPAVAIVSELVTNAVEHAGWGSGERRCVTVTQLYARGQLHLLVKDEGRGQPQASDVPPEAESGRGLLIVELITAELGGRWGFSLGSRTAWCVIPVQPRGTEGGCRLAVVRVLPEAAGPRAR